MTRNDQRHRVAPHDAADSPGCSGSAGLRSQFAVADRCTVVDAPQCVDDLLRAAPHLERGWLEAGFLLLLVGYGTKMGLAPMHAWLPDAHSESPSLVSALLSGALLNCAFLGILRAVQVLGAAGSGSFAAGHLQVLGLASMALGALFIVRQPDYKLDLTKDILFDPPNAQAGEVVTITTRLHNYSLLATGSRPAVRFYLGDPDQGGALIIGINGQSEVLTDAPIPARGQAIVRMSWQVPEGLRYPRIYAVIDPGGQIAEIHEDNNKAYSILGAYDGSGPPLAGFSADDSPDYRGEGGCAAGGCNFTLNLTVDSGETPPSAVPEPGTLSLVALGSAAVLTSRFRKRQRQL